MEERASFEAKRIRREYGVEQGVIKAPGKFEGEHEYVPYFWDLFMMGIGSENNDGSVSVPVTKMDRYYFKGLKGRKKIRLYTDDNGFVREL